MIKSYVVRTGHMSTHQRQGYNQYLPQYQLLQAGEYWDYASIFGRVADTIVEIGFGMGATLATMALENPHINYIGIEVHPPGIGALSCLLHEQQIHNVRIANFDAKHVFTANIQPESLSGVNIFFPDPWPKRKHYKRRLIQADFLKLLVRALQPAGVIHCATDWEAYAAQMLTVLQAHSELVNIADNGAYHERPLSRPVTKFESRGKNLGHGVWDLLFKKKST